MKITVARLKELGACKDQARLFKETFGPSVVVTEALCVQHADKFSWNWVAKKLRSAKALKTYNPVKAPDWEAYDLATTRAEEAYNLAVARVFGQLAEQQED